MKKKLELESLVINKDTTIGELLEFSKETTTEINVEYTIGCPGTGCHVVLKNGSPDDALYIHAYAVEDLNVEVALVGHKLIRL